VTGAPSSLAFRVWEASREHLSLGSFNARPGKPPPWWMPGAFDTPAGSWPKDHPLKAECKRGQAHEAHDPDGCEVPGCDHIGGIPAPGCRCGIYATRNMRVVSDYLRTAREPVLGLVEIGGRVIMAEPGHEGYARSQYARIAAILLIDRSLTLDAGTLRRLADAYHVPALVPSSVDPQDYRDQVMTTSTLADEADEYLRRLQEDS
jgi:hypothetical protein